MMSGGLKCMVNGRTAPFGVVLLNAAARGDHTLMGRIMLISPGLLRDCLISEAATDQSFHDAYVRRPQIDELDCHLDAINSEMDGINMSRRIRQWTYDSVTKRPRSGPASAARYRRMMEKCRTIQGIILVHHCEVDRMRVLYRRKIQKHARDAVRRTLYSIIQ